SISASTKRPRRKAGCSLSPFREWAGVRSGPVAGLPRRDERLRMMRVGLPRRPVAIVGLIAPRGPMPPCTAREQLDVRPVRARLDDCVLLIGLARVLTLPRRQ